MIRIGKIVATHGLQGAVVMTHIVGNSKWLKPEDVLFLELHKESYIPFFISQLKASNDEEYILNLEDTNSSEAARKLIGKNVYVNEDILSKHATDSPLLWIGFNVVDREKGSLGPIQDVMQAGPQWLAKIIYNDKEVLLPLVDEMILDVNVKNKFVRMDLPEGILDL
ncbi:MAG: ribosome maturation factor RimM [Flavipsychrobacter sp.]